MVIVFVQHIFVQPGEMVILNLLATDQLNNRREAIFALQGPQGEDVTKYICTYLDTFQNECTVPFRLLFFQATTHTVIPSNTYNMQLPMFLDC